MAMTLQQTRLRLTEAIYFGKPPGAIGAGFVKTNGTTPLTSNWNAGNFVISSQNSTNWFNVLAYGADNTGGGDASAAIQNAVTAAAVAKGNVYIPHGSYLINTAITVPNFVTIAGDGAGTILIPGGNNYVFDMNPAVRASIRDLAIIKFVGAQASGGAFNFANCQGNTWLANIYIGSNLHTILNMVPAAADLGGVYIDRMTVDAVTGCDTFLKIGGSAFNVAEIHLSRIFATAQVGGVQNWISCDGHTDSLDMNDVVFFQGVNGITLQNGGAGVNTNYTWRRVVVDTMTGTGISIDGTQLLQVSQLIINSCGTAGAPAIAFGSTASETDIVNGQVLRSVGSAISIANGVNALNIDGMQFADCNTSNTASRNGVDVAAGASGWKIVNCAFTNSASGHLKYGISVAAGASNHYVIGPNEYTGMETGSISNGATGTDAIVWDQERLGVRVPVPGRPIHVNGPIRISNANGIIWENNAGNEVGTFLSADASNRLVETAPSYGSTITLGTSVAITGANLGVNIPDPGATRTLDLNGTQRFRGIAAPAVSEANSATLYFDSGTNKLRASLNGGAYTNVIGSGGVTGSGSAGALTYWTGATDLTDEPNITLGGTYTLDVNGDINLTTDSNVIRIAGQVEFRSVPAAASLYIGPSGGSGNNQVAVGIANAGTGTDNTVIGSLAGAALTNGAFNTGIGSHALSSVTTGTNNVAVGVTAGGTTLTTGSNNVLVGFQADVNSGGLTNAVAIGYQAVVGASDSMVLGNASMKVGIVTSTPKTALDVDGAVCTRHKDIVLVNGINSDIALTDTSWVRFTGPTLAFSIGGFTGGTDGRILRVLNTTANAMTIVNLDAGSAAANQITTLTGGNVVLAARTSAATFIYEDVSDTWILMSTN